MVQYKLRMCVCDVCECGYFMWVLGTEFRLSGLHSKHFDLLSLLNGPQADNRLVRPPKNLRNHVIQPPRFIEEETPRDSNNFLNLSPSKVEETWDQN